MCGSHNICVGSRLDFRAARLDKLRVLWYARLAHKTQKVLVGIKHKTRRGLWGFREHKEEGFSGY